MHRCALLNKPTYQINFFSMQQDIVWVGSAFCCVGLYVMLLSVVFVMCHLFGNCWGFQKSCGFSDKPYLEITISSVNRSINSYNIFHHFFASVMQIKAAVSVSSLTCCFPGYERIRRWFLSLTLSHNLDLVFPSGYKTRKLNEEVYVSNRYVPD